MPRPRITDEMERRIHQPCRLRKWVAEWLDHREESAGVLIEEALIQTYSIPSPQPPSLRTD